MLESAAYQKWMSDCFGSGSGDGDRATTHVLLCEGDGFSSPDILSYTEKLRVMAPGMFPDLPKIHGLDKAQESGKEGMPCGGPTVSLRFQQGEWVHR